MSSKQNSCRHKKRRFHGNRYTGSLATHGSKPQSQTTQPQSLSPQKLSVLQPDPTDGDNFHVPHVSTVGMMQLSVVQALQLPYVSHAGHVMLTCT